MNEHEELISIIESHVYDDRYSPAWRITEIQDKIEEFRKKQSEAKTIKQIVAKHHNLKESDLCLVSRKIEIVEARQISMYFYRIYTKLSLKKIGAEFAYLEHKFAHKTVIDSIRHVNDLIDSDKLFKAKIEEIEKQVKRHY